MRNGISWYTENMDDVVFKELDAIDLDFIFKADSIINKENLIMIGKVRSYTNKGCVGCLVFSIEEAQEAINNNIPYIYYFNTLHENEKQVENYLRKSVGVVICGMPFGHILRMVSHGKIYYGRIDDEEKLKSNKDRWVSISPGDGGIFKGIQKFCIQNPMDNFFVRNLYEYLKKYVLSNPCEKNVIRAWFFLDIIFDKRAYDSLFQRETYKIANYHYPCYFFPDEEVIYFADLENETYNMKELVMGLNMSIRRIMGNEIPLGQHNKFFRPLFDPMDFIFASEYMDCGVKYIDYTQFTGMEFFDLKKYTKRIKSIDNIKIIFKTSIIEKNSWIQSPKYLLNFLDFSNPNGVDIILNALPYQNILVYVDNQKLEKKDIYSLYNMVRKSELM